MAMCSIASSFSSYKEFIIRNPGFATELESVCRWLSYLTAGRFSNSSVLCELLYSSSNLLTLANDLVLRNAANLPVNLNEAVSTLYTFLAVLEHTEVFLELAAAKAGGELAKWCTIVIVQIIKTTFKLLLLVKHRQGIFRNPPISPLNRKRDLPNAQGPHKGPSDSATGNGPLSYYSLRRSGRNIRTIDSVPPLSKRSWKPPPAPTTSDPASLNSGIRTRVTFPPTRLEGDKLAGEILYLLKPLTHLAAMGIFGKTSWKPWALALGCDMTSLHLIGNRNQLIHSEQLELSRRALTLLLYSLRSPLYDQFTKQRLLLVLQILAARVPLIGYFIRPLADYLPEWQNTYSRVWSS